MFNLYYKWYLKDFLNTNTRITENEIQALGDFKENISLKSLDMLEQLKLDKLVFYKDSAIAHISLMKESIGKIIKMNDSLSTMTKYKKSDLLG